MKAVWLLLIISLVVVLVEAEGKTLGKKVKDAAAKGVAAAVARKARSRFFSAWTIIGLVLLLIGVGVGGYYLFVFYPLVCAKRGKYDVMEMVHV